MEVVADCTPTMNTQATAEIETSGKSRLGEAMLLRDSLSFFWRPCRPGMCPAFVLCSAFFSYVCPVFFLRLSYICSAFASYLHRVLHFSCICPAFALHPVFFLHLSYICPAFALHLSYICPAITLRNLIFLNLSCICPVFALHLSCICPALEL